MTLRQFMFKLSLTAKDIAEPLGISEAYVSTLRAGGGLPSLTLALKIAVVTGSHVTPYDWVKHKDVVAAVKIQN